MTCMSSTCSFSAPANSARSIMAEAILNKIGAGKFRAFSAASQPKGRLNPYAVQLLQSLGYDTSTQRSKSWSEFAEPGAPLLDFCLPSATTPRASPVPPGRVNQ